MNIQLKSVTPTYFTPTSSEVWSKVVDFVPNETYLIRAVSGSGKSSLFNFLYGLNNLFSGTISFDGTDISQLPEAQWTTIRRTQISIVFQGLRLFPELTALENIQLKNQLTAHKTEAEIMAYLERLDVAQLANKKVETLSYGQQQRVAIVRALCQPFSVLLLDEPFSHIDASQIENAKTLILEEVNKQQASLLLASLGDSYAIDYTKIYAL